MSSRIHYRGQFDLDRVRDTDASYLGTRAYARSKLANVLYTLALARRLEGTASP